MNYNTNLNTIVPRSRTSRRIFVSFSFDTCSRRSSSSTKNSCATFLEGDPFLASVHEASAIHLRDPYPYEFSYASDRYTYSWRNSFAGNRKEGSVSSRRTAPVHFFFFLSRAVYPQGLCSIHYGFTLDRRGNPHQHILRMWRVFSNRS